MRKTGKLSRFFSFLWPRYVMFNERWDTLLNLLMDKAEVTSITKESITFDGDYTVWIANHPYSSGALFTDSKGLVSSAKSSMGCSIKTAIRLEDFVNARIGYEHDTLGSAIEYYKNK